jgi:hypothetical protein
VNWEALARVALEVISTIGDVVSEVKDRRQTDGLRAAADALTVIGAIVESVRSKDVESIDPDVIAGELARLKEALRSNDAVADRALADKFDKEE